MDNDAIGADEDDRRPARPTPLAALTLLLATSALLAALLVVVAGGDDGPDDRAAPTTGDEVAPEGPPATAPTAATTTTIPDATLPELVLDPRPGPFQLTLDQVPDGLAPGTVIEVGLDDRPAVASATVSDRGTVLVRDLEPGVVRLYPVADGERTARSAEIVIPGDEPADGDLYRATTLGEGYSYIPTRDGTTLSVLVTLPGPIADGPYPTLVEYSGYDPSRPGSDDPSRLIVPALGYALVQVNVRGTGCSGGSFDAFEAVQALDGYDVVETVAAQDWSGRVGMFGISYAGIMQIHVAATRPPSLAAIAPLSVFADLDAVIRPGGIDNDGFAATWAAEVGDGARSYGQGWEQARVDAGDTTCAANQALRSHNPDLLELARSSPFDTDLLGSRSPLAAAPSVEVPVLLAGAWQDELTGPDWPDLIDAFEAAPVVRAEMYNGLHVDAISPEVLRPLTEFYDLYLDDPEPGAGLSVRLGLSLGLAALYGETLPVRFSEIGEDRETARADYEATDPVHVRFEAGARRPNLPVAGFEASFTAWPPPQVEATSMYLSPDSSAGRGLGLSPQVPVASAAAAFVTDPAEGDLTAGDRDGLWTNDPHWTWPAAAAGSSLRIVGEALVDDVILAGPASADLWISADAVDADVEVTLSEIGPDGSETYLQSGWLRLSRRALAAEATELQPRHSRDGDDVAPLDPDGAPVLVRVGIPPVAAALRAGSRLALTIDTPGGSRPAWTFDVLPEPVEVTVHSSPERPSRIVLPVLPGLSAPTDRPACGTLRGQPCRLP